MTDSLDPPELSTLLDRLFDLVPKADGTPYSMREVADKITDKGTPISHSYIAQLRNGKKSDPTISHLRGLAHFFGVPVEYFITPGFAEEVDRELVMMARLQELEARKVALRDSVIPDAVAAIDTITRLLETIRAIEQPPEAADEDR